VSASRCAVGLFCISAAALGYELVLMRLLALAQWGHFAGFVISIAMLGLAASGLFLHFRRERIEADAAGYFAAGAGGFAFLAPLAYAMSQQVPFNPFMLAWTNGEYLRLGLRVLLFFIPFFCAGAAICVPFVARALPPSQLYLWNMTGSAAPFFALWFGMDRFHPIRLLAPVTIPAVLAACAIAARWPLRIICITAGLLGFAIATWTPFRYSEYKDLSKTLTLPEAKIVDQHYSPYGVVHSVHSPFTRYLPGLSLNFTGSLPRAELVFVDGSAMEVVFDAAQALNDPTFLRMSPEAFSFQLRVRPRVLLAYGGPVEILRALAHQAAEVVSVDDLAARGEAIDGAWHRFGDSPFGRKEVRHINDEARHYVQTTRDTFDVILLSMLGSHGSSTAGAASLDLSCLLTVEGLATVFERLSPGGHAVLSAWVENPPRAGVRLAALLVDTLRKLGIAEPGRHLLALRSWSTVSFFVTREPCDASAIARMKRFAEENSFDLVYFAGIKPEEANRFNVIPEEPYCEAVRALLEPGRGEFRERWPFRLDAPTDDRPFFNHHFRWRAVPKFVSRMGKEWIPFIEWGYLLQVASLVVTGLLGFVLLIVPCALTRARPDRRSVLLFFTLGLAYMFVEIWAIYRMIQFLSWPMTASAVVLTAMLAASGAGAALLAHGAKAPRCRRIAAGMIVALLLLALAEFPALTALSYSRSLPVRALVGGLWIAVPAFFMGFPFPHALAHLKRREEIPWALALNGFGSVLGGLGATLVAVHFGLTALALAAVGLYALVAALACGQRSAASALNSLLNKEQPT